MSMLLCLVAALLIAAIVWFQLRKKEGLVQYTYDAAKDFVGPSYKSTSNQPISSCIKECTDTPECKSLVVTTYTDDYNALCYFKDSTTTSPTSSNKSNVYTKKEAEVDGSPYSQQPNTVYMGNDLSVFKLETKEECQNACDQNDKCNAVVFNGTSCVLG